MVSHADIVGSEEDVSWNHFGGNTEFLCKTKENIKNSGALTPYTPMNQDEADAYVNNPSNGYIEIE